MKPTVKLLLLILIIFNINLFSQDIDTTKKGEIFQKDKDNDYIPNGYYLTPARINPFGAVYGAKFSIPDTSNIIININEYKKDSTVSTIRKNCLPPGNYIFNWNGKDSNGIEVKSGIYTLELNIIHINIKNNIEVLFWGRTMLPIYLTKKDRGIER